MELSLFVLFLVVLCGRPIWMANHCPNADNKNCPEYKVISETPEFEKREYEPTDWICAKVKGTEDSDFLAAHSTLKEAVGHDLDNFNPWPVLITLTNDNKLLLCWFLPPGVAVQEKPSVSRERRPKSIVYVKNFDGIPNVTNGQANAKKLCEVLKQPGKTCTFPFPYSGACYESLFAIHHHNEVWIDESK